LKGQGQNSRRRQAAGSSFMSFMSFRSFRSLALLDCPGSNAPMLSFLNMHIRSALLVLALLAGAAAAAAVPLTVYDDQLRNGFADWSWATHNLAQTSTVHAGSAAVSF